MEKSIRKWWVLITVSLAVFMAMLDITIVNVALPDIQRSFSSDFSNLQWVLNAYTLVYAAMLLPVSKLGDIIGRKKVFLMGLGIFVIGSLTSGLAGSDLWLNIFRGVQGVGGAAMMSLSLTIVTASFPEKQRGLALGIWSSVVGLAISGGPLIGGALVDSFGWRSIFLVNIPFGIAAILLGMFFIQESNKNSKGKIDYLGFVFSTAMIFTMVLALIQKEVHENYSWTDWHVLSLLGLSIVLLIAFIITERMVKQPMIELSIFKSRSFNGANIAAFVLGAGLYGGFTYLTILMQNYMGYSAFETGVKMLLISGFTIILGPLAGMVSGKIGNRWLISGALFIGAIGIIVIRQTIKVPVEWSYLMPGFVLLGISNALVNPPIANAAMSSIDKKQVGMASGILNVFRQVGISFGVVMLGIKLTEGYNHSLDRQFMDIQNIDLDSKNQMLDVFHEAGAFAGSHIFDSKQAETFKQVPAFDDIKNMVFTAFNDGIKEVDLLISIFLLIGVLASVFLIRNKREPK
ncbi:MFS transporter [Paenibacillus sp. JDR-2]|uniref:MFS transporter n=1 Tax=Paenibacillus sp. (strain JDR-2) TaxID=324057 RepID=UPI0001666A63|nr:MFS transporter [Paenibacillus sp. JDR-2]ACT03171.1 drug resistance transporter, EmrB/QacA subfamily [Paenibacillus sp. JDR-2]